MFIFLKCHVLLPKLPFKIQPKHPKYYLNCHVLLPKLFFKIQSKQLKYYLKGHVLLPKLSNEIQKYTMLENSSVVRKDFLKRQKFILSK